MQVPRSLRKFLIIVVIIVTYLPHEYLWAGLNGNSNMSRKRRNTSSPEPDDTPSPKSRDLECDWDGSDADDDSREAPHVDAFSGQIGAFPGLGKDNGELFYGPASDGIDYLRMVRLVLI